MNHFGRIAIVVASSLLFFSSAHAISTFGTYAQGSDLDPDSGFLQDGGEGSSSAAVSFTTFRAEADFDPLSTYLPLLKAESDGSGALFDDDRTQAYAEAYQVFTSASNQTIQLDIRLDSVVTNSAGGTSSVLSDIYVIGGSDFRLDDFFCSSGQRGDMGIYLCGERIATSSSGLSFSNLFNGGSSPLLLDTLTFTVGAGETFGILATLSAGSFQGTADAFNTLSLEFEDDSGIRALTIPDVGQVPLPAAVWMFGAGLLGLLGFTQKKK